MESVPRRSRLIRQQDLVSEERLNEVKATVKATVIGDGDRPAGGDATGFAGSLPSAVDRLRHRRRIQHHNAGISAL